MMDSRIKVDRISVLPDNVKNSILTRLTIKEAVRSSVLSQSWRYQWHSLSKININRGDLLGVSPVECVKIIDHILLFHCGSFDKFKLDIDFDAPNDIDRWILYLSRHGIKDLIISIRVGRYNIPTHLFSCSGLTRLELSRCRFKPLPAAFKAFSNLTELFLNDVDIDDEVFEKLISSCPLLSKLSLLYVCFRSFLRINAPKLVMLIHRSLRRALPLLKNTPLLKFAVFVFWPLSFPSFDGYYNIFELLHSMPLLQRLELNCFALQNLAVGDAPANHPLTCPVKHLILWINLNDLKETQAAFCIFRSSPFIRILDLTFFFERGLHAWTYKTRIPADAFWKGEHYLGLRFDNLQEVKITNFTGTEYGLKFIEFVLANAPALETMEIKFWDKCMNAEELYSVITKLTWFPRASPKAKLILPSKMSLILPSN